MNCPTLGQVPPLAPEGTQEPHNPPTFAPAPSLRGKGPHAPPGATPGHLTEKPVALAVRALEYSSRPGENCLDLFGGSGSTLIGAQQAGRKAFLMELDEAYCDVIVQRFWNLTQIPPRLIRDGEEIPWEKVSDGFATAVDAGGESSDFDLEPTPPISAEAAPSSQEG